jgi:hypothetical protein
MRVLQPDESPIETRDFGSGERQSNKKTFEYVSDEEEARSLWAYGKTAAGARWSNEAT